MSTLSLTLLWPTSAKKRTVQTKAKETTVSSSKQDDIALIEAIKKGDEILTSGGIIAKVTKADGEKLNVDIAPNVNVVVYRSTVADVINKK